MLITLEPHQIRPGFDQFFEEAMPEEIFPGIYHGGFNFSDNLVEGLVKTEYPFEPEFGRKNTTTEERIAAYKKMREENPKIGLPTCSYGVCDEPLQVLTTFPGLAVVDNKYVIGVAQLLKKEMYPKGGWRWHKWGPYIGEQKPMCEYLYDEPVIEEVWTFHILELN